MFSDFDARKLALAVIATIRESQVTFLAAALAFYAFVSIIPLALLGLALGQFVGMDRIAPIVSGGEQFLTPEALDIVARSLADRRGQGGATVVGTLVLLWSGSRVFQGLDIAFAQVYGKSESDSIPSKLLDLLIVLGAIPAALVAGGVFGVVLPLFEWLPGSGLLSRLALLLVLGVVFFPLYYRFPDVDVTVREALPGTAVAAVGWALLATGFSVYAASLGTFHLYGILGAGLLLVTWLYLGGIIIMVGAVVNTVLAGAPSDDRRDGPKSDQRDRSAADSAPDIGELEREVDRLRDELDEKTVSRSNLESELKAYVRTRQRAGKATGWGPYLVLLYGTIMTLGAFYWLSGGWAILAMIVVWLSTLGLYVQLVIFGLGLQATSVPGRLLDVVRNWRS
ncbi:YihY/virulence factor BrkB family protein [Halodesulfurarchaeum sp.]|uniref:YihY/virulence factor BrkB family protein n=1 Tax=Halodesulfurarchaeum sp. TaxID=1980530 RepID=UPI002FC3C430